jgi:acyl-CoA synthetase (AMP-forming)/AMP-acid ligase II
VYSRQVLPRSPVTSVPSMVLDLIDNGEELPLETFNFGGAPAPDVLAARANRVFPKTSLSVPPFLSKATHLTLTTCRAQGYGLTETNAVAVAICV